MGDSEIIVRPATKRDLSGIAAVLAEAFFDDPAMTWLLPDDNSRKRRLRVFFGTLLRYEMLRPGGVELARTGDRLVGAALWLPPGQWHPRLRLAELPGLVRAFGRRLGPASVMANAQARAHPGGEPHWYLSAIGVHPAAQGTGVGGALLRARLAHCDAAGIPAYLESSKTTNVSLYEHFGFEVTGALALPDDAPPVPTMWRHPRVPGRRPTEER
jgi:GNAT superfamily N-acetyltransferase